MEVPMMQNRANTRKHEGRRSVAALGLLVVVAFGLGGCSQLRARDQLNKGVANFREGHYDLAIENFKASRELDPELLNARIYLASAYQAMYIPGAPSDENVRNGEQAVAEFQDVLSQDANNLSAIDGLGSILYSMAATPFQREKYEESKTYHQRHIALSPNDPEPYYWVGVINWTLANRANLELRQAYNVENPRRQLRDPDPLPDNLRTQFTEQNAALVDEGLQALDKAMQLRPEYADAIAYKSLLLRQKADQSDTTMRAEIEKQADELLEQSRVIKQREAEKAAKS
jgi:tetratricopeptide (TPR) repeat protein